MLLDGISTVEREDTGNFQRGVIGVTVLNGMMREGLPSYLSPD